MGIYNRKANSSTKNDQPNYTVTLITLVNGLFWSQQGNFSDNIGMIWMIFAWWTNNLIWHFFWSNNNWRLKPWIVVLKLLYTVYFAIYLQQWVIVEIKIWILLWGIPFWGDTSFFLRGHTVDVTGIWWGWHRRSLQPDVILFSTCLSACSAAEQWLNLCSAIFHMLHVFCFSCSIQKPWGCTWKLNHTR